VVPPPAVPGSRTSTRVRMVMSFSARSSFMRPRDQKEIPRLDNN
jgi:hypothetical protein